MSESKKRESDAKAQPISKRPRVQHVEDDYLEHADLRLEGLSPYSARNRELKRRLWEVHAQHPEFNNSLELALPYLPAELRAFCRQYEAWIHRLFPH